MKILLLALLAIVLFGVSVSKIEADTPTVFVVQAFAYSNILGDIDDALILIRYELPVDDIDDSPDPPLFTPIDWDDLWDADNDGAAKPDSDDRFLTPVDAIIRLETDIGGLLSATHPLRLGEGVAGMYFEEGDLPFTFGDALNIVLVGNPSTVGTGAVSAILPVDWNSTANHTATSLSLASDLVDLMTDIEQEFNDFTPGQLLTSGFINITGRDLLLDAYPLIDQVAPSAFTISSQVVPVDGFDPSSDELQAIIDATVGSQVSGGLTGLADLFEVTADFLGILLAFVLSIPLALILLKVSRNSSFGIFAFTGGLVWAGMTSFLPIIFLLIVAGIFFAIGGLWIASKIPMN